MYDNVCKRFNHVVDPEELDYNGARDFRPLELAVLVTLMTDCVSSSGVLSFTCIVLLFCDPIDAPSMFHLY